MELKLNTQSQQDFDEIMAKKINLLRESFISRTAKFDGKFRAGAVGGGYTRWGSYLSYYGMIAI